MFLLLLSGRAHRGSLRLSTKGPDKPHPAPEGLEKHGRQETNGLFWSVSVRAETEGGEKSRWSLLWGAVTVLERRPGRGAVRAWP